MIALTKKTIRGAIHGLGYELRQRPAVARPRLAYGVEGKVVEFVGTSGVGKSTLYNALLTLRAPADPWLTRKEALAKRPAKPGEAFPDVYERIMEWKLKEAPGWTLPAAAKLRRLSLQYNQAVEDLAYQAVLGSHAVVIDEGLLYNYTRSLTRLAETDLGALQTFMQNRAVVFCNAPAEQLARYVQARAEQGVVRTFHDGMTSAELLAWSKRNIDYFAGHWADLIRISGVPRLEVDTSEAPEKNARTVHTFIERLTGDKTNGRPAP